MMSLLVQMLIKNKDEVSNPSVKKAYATLSSVVGIVLNLFLCTAKIVIGLLSHSVSISADGFNNLSDAGTNLVSLLGFKIARYGGGSTHPFGHGRIEWIMGIFASIAVLLMGIKLAGTSIDAISNPQEQIFSVGVVIVLVLSIIVKFYMYYYNKQFAKITDSETLKATATDCVSDSIATIAVLVSTIISHFTQFEIDGYCGVLVSIFIIFAGVKSLWEVLGRIMGKAADEETKDVILKMVEAHPEIIAVHNLMLHDYGFGYFVVSMRAEGYRKDSEQLYTGVNQISYELYQKFHCDCFIQIDYLLEDEALTHVIFQKTYTDSSFNRHTNYGEYDRYFCKGHHEAIISHEIYDKANELVDRRGKEKGNGTNTERYLNRYVFSGKIKCGECDSTFKRRKHSKPSGDYIAWCCSRHIEDNRNEQYDDLVEEIYKLREEKQQILADKAEMEGVKQSIFNMKAFLNSQTTEIEEYDEQLVRRLIAKVTVYDERFEVELKSGLSVDIQRSK